MNKLENAYSLLLEARKRAGEIEGYEYEGVTLQLAPGARYTPDFVVWEHVPGTLVRLVELHECKGFMREAALVRLRVAVKTYPCFRFKLCRLKRNHWTIEDIT